MNRDWPTQAKDMYLAQLVIEQYANETNCDSLGLFELVVNEKEKCMDFRLSSWVVILAKQFHDLYGAELGDSITRQVISRCMTGGETLH